MLAEYFAERQWRGVSLEDAVRRGNALEQTTGQVFTWLTSTNAGAAEICSAALRVAGIDEEELSTGIYATPRRSPPCGYLPVEVSRCV